MMIKQILCATLLMLVVTVAEAQNARLYFNFGKNYTETSPWNNAGADPSSGLSFNNLLDDSGNNTGISIQSLTNWGGLYAQGAGTGNDSGVVPDNVLKEYYWFGIYGAPNETRLRVSGLMPGAMYNFEFIGSSLFRASGITDNGNTVYTIGSNSVSLYVEGNTLNSAQLSNIEADSQGQVEIVLTKDTNAAVGYINALIIDLPQGLYSPADFSALYTTGTGVTMNWQDNNTTETSYEVYRSEEGGSFNLLTILPANTVTYLDATAVEGRQYSYRVRAVNASYVSGYTPAVSTVIPVSIGNAVNVGDSVLINFSKDYNVPLPWNNTQRNPVTPGITFNNLYDTDATNTGISIEFVGAWGGVYPQGATTGNNSGIIPDDALQEYYWFGIFGAPNEVTFKIKGLTPGLNYNLDFIGSSLFHDNGITENGSTQFIIGTHTQSVDVEANTSSSAAFQGVRANILGEIQVKARKGTDASVGYLNALIIGLPVEMLYTPTIQDASYTENIGVNLVWQDVNTAETGYEIYRRNLTTGAPYSLIATTGSNSSGYNDVSAEPQNIYRYQMRAINAQAASGYSPEVEVRTIGVKKVYINLTLTAEEPLPWNNTKKSPTENLKFDNLVDENGVNTGLSLRLTSPWGGAYDEGTVTGNNSGIVPDNVLQEYYWFGIFGAPNEARFVVDGLDTSSVYNLKLVGSSIFRGGGTDNGTTVYTINGQSKSLYVESNTTEWVEFFDLIPNTEGQIEVVLTKGSNTPAGYLNALILELPEDILYTPAGFQATYVSNSGVHLEWDSNTINHNGYEVYRTDVTGNSSPLLLASLDPADTSYVDETVADGNVYSYSIRAVSSQKQSVFSRTIEVECIPTKKVYFNFSKNYPGPFPWNNTGRDPALGARFENLIDEHGADTGIDIELLTEWGAAFTDGAQTGNNSGIVPDNVLKEYYFFGILGAPNVVSFRVSGLTPGAKYNFSFVGSSVWRGYGVTDNGYTTYAIGTSSISLYVEGNTAEAGTLKSIIADSLGQVDVILSKGTGASVGYINALIIEMPDVPSAYWPIADGNWSEPIWSHDKTATSGTTLPDGSTVNIEGRVITLTDNATVRNLRLGAYNGQAGVLFIDNASLTHIGRLEVSSDHANNRIEIINQSTLTARPAQVKIMPLGNSITQGSSTTYSYRYELWKKLTDAGIDFDFAGSQTTNHQGSPSFPDYNGHVFDPDNEGHWGWRADEIMQQLPGWSSANRPDIVLLHVGTNDMMQWQSAASTADEIRSIIDILREANPIVKILLAKVIGNNNVNMGLLNSEIEQVVSDKHTVDSPVILVDQFTGFNIAQDLYDGIHPNAVGETKMADKWFQAIVANLTPVATPENGLEICNENSQSDDLITIQNSYVPSGCSNMFSSEQRVVIGSGFVLQAGAQSSFSSTYTTSPLTVETLLNNFSFQYRYDARKRMIKKKVPGADWVYMVYDKRDRLVMTQDGNQRAADPKEWTFTKYDALNRPVLTGIYRDPLGKNQEEMQLEVNTFYASATNDQWYERRSDSVHDYSNNSFPNVPNPDDYLTVTYYDNYDVVDQWPGYLGYSDIDLSATSNTITYNQPDARFPRVIGQVTATKVRNLDEGYVLWYRAINYYDDRYRVVQSVSENIRDGVDRTTTIYDFTGKVLLTKTTHQEGSSQAKVVTRRFAYDHAGRLLETHHQVNDEDEVLLAKNEYNELGQLVTKQLHSEDENNFKQHVDYRYNIRGWLTRINDSDVLSSGNQDENQDATLPDLFGMNLLYNEQDADLQNDDLYNGNISAIKWSNNLGLHTNDSWQPGQRAYTYAYDRMNRLKSASHFEAYEDWGESSSFFEGGLLYDLNGNILSLNRTTANGADMDALTYDYGEGTANHSNKLRSVTDYADVTKGFKDGNTVGNDYEYDANGNMVRDRNKDIESITYNHLNLPYIVRKTSGDYIKYIYDATGMKLCQEVYNASDVVQKKTDYIGEFIYEDDALQFINQEEGRIIVAGEVPEYQYHLKDHLGNVRLTFTTKEEVEEATATLEAAHASEEQGEFLNYAEARKIDNPMFDHTDEGGTFNAVRLMGGNTTETYGLAKSLSVMPGDVINMEVYAKYLDPNPANWSAALLNIIQAIAGTTNPGGTFVDGGAIGSINGPFPYPGLLTRDNDTGDGPKAYLNYIIFDREFNYINGGFRRVSTAAREAGQGTDPAEGIGHEHLFLENITITEPGYVYIYLSNENETPVEVFFDDFTVEHIKSPVVQMDDYYPFGATFNSYSRENSVHQSFLYQEKEWLTDLNLSLYDFEWRQYDPLSARTTTMDPHADSYSPLSPYSWVANNPISIIDPDGQDITSTAFSWNYTGADAQNLFRQLQSQQNGGGYEKDERKDEPSVCFSCGYSYFTQKRNADRAESNFGGFWNGLRGFGNGIVEGGESTVDFVKSLGTVEGWRNMAEGFALLGAMANPTIITPGKLLLQQQATEYIMNVPNMPAYEIGYGIGYGSEKLAETILLSKGAGAAARFMNFSANGGYGVSMNLGRLGKFEFMYRNPSVRGGTLFSYKSVSGGKFRLDYHSFSSRGRTLHFHTNYWGYSIGPHRSLNPLRFGQPIK